MKKRLLCAILCAVMIFGAVITSSAAYDYYNIYHTVPKSEWTETHLLIDNYLNENYNLSAYHFHEYFDYEDYTICFAAYYKELTEEMYVFGNYYLWRDTTGPDRVCPIYAIKDNKVYTLQNLYDDNLVDFAGLVKGLGGNFYGDANCDWKLDITDVTKIQKFLACDYYSNRNIPEYDYDCDGFATIKDATAIQKYLAQSPQETTA